MTGIGEATKRSAIEVTSYLTITLPNIASFPIPYELSKISCKTGLRQCCARREAYCVWRGGKFGPIQAKELK